MLKRRYYRLDPHKVKQSVAPLKVENKNILKMVHVLSIIRSIFEKTFDGFKFAYIYVVVVFCTAGGQRADEVLDGLWSS